VIYRWFRWWTLLTLPFVASPFVVGGMMFVEAYTEEPSRIFGALPVLAFSMILAYLSMAYLVNSTEVSIEGDLLTVRHGPLPWKGCAFRLRDCEEFRADKIYEGRFTTDGVRIRFVDNSFENLVYAKNPEQAKQWSRELNEYLFLLKADQGRSKPST
jgi:hypothetical protein